MIQGLRSQQSAVTAKQRAALANRSTAPAVEAFANFACPWPKSRQISRAQLKANCVDSLSHRLPVQRYQAPAVWQ
jgi:hypothetical protein